MGDDLEKMKDLAKFMSMLRYVHTENKVDNTCQAVQTHLIAANVKVSDAIMHMEKAFNILLEN